VISRTADATMRLWDTLNVRPLGRPMNCHALGTLPVAVSLTPDGQRIASVDWDPTRRLWPKPVQWMWPTPVCAKLSQNVSHQQWRNWVAADVGHSQICRFHPTTGINRDASLKRVTRGENESQNE
jgi:hypothetical protein